MNDTTKTFLAKLLELRASEFKVQRLMSDLSVLKKTILEQKRELQRLKCELDDENGLHGTINVIIRELPDAQPPLK